MRNIEAFRRDLIGWFETNKRDLPWRRKRTPYAVWVSEIMLQQTQVKTVIPYFNRWIKTIPSVKALAKIPERTLLGLWQGLGYYSRARNLQKSARHLLANHGGRLPDTYEELIKIPGIGPYSAGAIASLAFNRRVPLADGNVLRVMARVYAIRTPIDQERTKNRILELASRLVPKDRPGDYNEASMELGALICQPKNPLCGSCPVRRHCVAFKKGIAEKLPVKQRRQKITKVRACAVVLNKNGRFFLHRRPAGELMGGLWEFPEWKTNEADEKIFLSKRLDIPPQDLKLMDSIKRYYTRFAETMNVYTAGVKKTPEVLENTWKKRWVTGGDLRNYPLSSAHAKIRSMAAGD